MDPLYENYLALWLTIVKDMSIDESLKRVGLGLGRDYAAQENIEIEDMFKEGVSIKTIAEKTGHTPSGVCKRLANLGHKGVTE